MCRQQFLPRSAKKSGELWSTNNKILHVHFDLLKSTFLEDHMLATSGCCRLKFLHALENDQGLLAHTVHPPKTNSARDFGQLYTSIAIISGTDQEINKQYTALSSTVFPRST